VKIIEKKKVKKKQSKKQGMTDFNLVNCQTWIFFWLRILVCGFFSLMKNLSQSGINIIEVYS